MSRLRFHGADMFTSNLFFLLGSFVTMETSNSFPVKARAERSHMIYASGTDIFCSGGLVTSHRHFGAGTAFKDCLFTANKVVWTSLVSLKIRLYRMTSLTHTTSKVLGALTKIFSFC